RVRAARRRGRARRGRGDARRHGRGLPAPARAAGRRPAPARLRRARAAARRLLRVRRRARARRRLAAPRLRPARARPRGGDARGRLRRGGRGLAALHAVGARRRDRGGAGADRARARDGGVRIRDARIVATAVDPAGFPRDGLPEVAFLGRSNAGKSSLLNALAGRRELARVSSTPGKTRALHWFRIERLDDADRVHVLCFVDLPGYGFARVAKSERAAWQRLVESYLDGRAPLRAA